MSEIKTILLIDDERHMLRFLELNIRPLGWRILTAEGGAQALEILHREPVDLMLVDYQMPEMNGLEFVAKVRELPAYHKTPVVMLTARGHSSLKGDASEAGVSLYMNKPFSPRELQATLKKLLGA